MITRLKMRRVGFYSDIVCWVSQPLHSLSHKARLDANDIYLSAVHWQVTESATGGKAQLALK